MTTPDTLAARAAIEDALLSYTRGIDRLDAELVAAAFHDDAVLVDYGPEPMTIGDFVAHALPSLRAQFSATQHRVSNLAIEIRGDQAVAEAYVLAFHVDESGDVPRLLTFAGRYIDRHERRDGVWKIARRVLRCDWSKVETIDEPMGTHWPRSARDRTDVIYDAFD